MTKKKIDCASRCIVKRCEAKATWWVMVRVEGIDEWHARCDRHAT